MEREIETECLQGPPVTENIVENIKKSKCPRRLPSDYQAAVLPVSSSPPGSHTLHLARASLLASSLPVLLAS